jgi:hypothetical protein
MGMDGTRGLTQAMPLTQSAASVKARRFHSRYSRDSYLLQQRLGMGEPGSRDGVSVPNPPIRTCGWRGLALGGEGPCAESFG